MSAKGVRGWRSNLPAYTITPLGAAIVEALPDQTKVRAINRAFRRSGKCPTSSLFPSKADVREFYAK